MANLTGATNYFTKAAENTATMTLASSIAAGATTVPLTGSATNYSDGDIVCFVIEPTVPANKQVFTGKMLAGSVTGVIWTFGTNVPHTAGVAVIDYVTATDWDLMQKGLLVSHNQDGTLKPTIVSAPNIANGGVNYANLLATIFSGQLTSYANTGAGAGTFKYVNVGGLKILFGTTLGYAVGAAGGQADVIINFPANFFTTTPAVMPSLILSANSDQSINLINVSTSLVTIRTYNAGSATATADQCYIIAIGT